MSRTSYSTLLARPGAAAFFAVAGAGRVGIAMTALGLLWLVLDATGSYATAGLVTAAVAVAEAVVGPQVARAVDRRGQRRVLLVVAPVHLAAVAAVVVLATASAPTAALVAGGALVGGSVPQLGALSSARWVALLRGERDELTAAFSLESVANALAYLLGPVLVSSLAQAGDPVLGTALAACLVAAGSLGLAALRGSAPVPDPRDGGPPVGSTGVGSGGVGNGSRGVGSRGAGSGGGRRPGRRGLLAPVFLLVVALNVAVGGFFGSSQVAVTAAAVALDTPAAVFFGLSSAAGVLAGWAYGLRRWRSGPHRQLLVLGAVLALACGGLAVAGSAPAVAAGLALTGAVIPPVLVLCTVLVERSVPAGVLTQAFTWVGSAGAAGSAVAASVTGAVLDGAGPDGAPAGFLVCLGSACGLTLLAVGVRRARPAGGTGGTLVR